MPRFLWLGLMLCALCVLAAVAWVRGLAPAPSADPSELHVSAQPARPAVELLASSESAPIERAAITSASAPASSPGPDRVRVRRGGIDHGDVGIGTSAPEPFAGGIVEVHVVRDEDSTPIAGAEVVLGVEARTDARGVATFTEVSESWAEVTASFAGRATARTMASPSWESPIAVVELRLAAQREVTVRLLDPLGRPFRAQDWHLERRVADRLGILLARSCGAIGSSPDVQGAPAYRARSGERDLGPFTWMLEVQGLDDACVLAVLSDVIVGAETLDPRATELAVRVDPAAILSALAPVVVRVLAAAGDVPIEGALVAFEQGVPEDPDLRTGADGRVSVGFSRSGVTNLVVSAPGFAPARLVLSRPFPAELVARLTPGRRIEGRVVDQDDSPLAGAQIEVLGAGLGAVAGMRSARGGVFRIRDLPSAEFKVHATYTLKSSAGGGQRVTAIADCRAGDVLDLRLVIPVAKSKASPAPR